MKTRRAELWEASVLIKDVKCTIKDVKCTIQKVPKLRIYCQVEGCSKQKRAGGKCVGHGGGKPCNVKDCDKQRMSGGSCFKHGGGARCEVNGCDKKRQSGGKCSLHGGGTRCQVNGCDKKRQMEGKCNGHASGRRCQVVECLREFCQRVIREDADGVQHHIKVQDMKNVVSKRQESSGGTTHAPKKRKTV